MGGGGFFQLKSCSKMFSKLVFLFHAKVGIAMMYIICEAHMDITVFFHFKLHPKISLVEIILP
jgi:hypothetical protein